MRGDYVLVQSCWFEMMNSARRRNSPPTTGPQSNSAGKERRLCAESTANAGSEIERRGRSHGTFIAERDIIQTLKPRPTQTRSNTITSASYSERKSKWVQDALGDKRCSSFEHGSGERSKDIRVLMVEGGTLIPQPRCRTSCQTCVSTFDPYNKGGGFDGNSQAGSSIEVEDKGQRSVEERNGYALVNGVYHQMLQPGGVAPRPRKKLQKTQRGIKNGRDDSIGSGGEGPRMIAP